MTCLKKKSMSNVKIVAENYIKSAFYITRAFGVAGKFSQSYLKKKRVKIMVKHLDTYLLPHNILHFDAKVKNKNFGIENNY